jgi:hypothetical protein
VLRGPDLAPVLIRLRFHAGLYEAPGHSFTSSFTFIEPA